jgi:hypothetical protein
MIKISYVIIEPTLSKFSSYGGAISKIQFQGEANQDLNYIVSPNSYYALYGLTSLSINIKNNKFTI